jgi:hypothetical protein
VARVKQKHAVIQERHVQTSGFESPSPAPGTVNVPTALPPEVGISILICPRFDSSIAFDLSALA